MMPGDLSGACASRGTGSTVVVGKGRTVAAGAAGSRVAVARPAGLWVLLLGAAVAAASARTPACTSPPAGR